MNGVLDAQQQISDRLRAELGVHSDRIWSNEQPTPGGRQCVLQRYGMVAAACS